MLPWLGGCSHRKVAVLIASFSTFYFVLTAINSSEAVAKSSFGKDEASAFVLSVAELRNTTALHTLQKKSHIRRAASIKNITPSLHFQSSLTGTVTVSSSTTAQSPRTARSPSASRCLDFYLIGWPKTGSTALAQVLQYHPEVVMPLEESTEWWRRQPDPLASLNRELLALEQRKLVLGSLQRKRGIKFPGEYKERGGLKVLQENGCNTTKIIVGIRHPIALFESFYNYRVQEWHAPGNWFYQKEGPIPLPNELMGTRNWGDGVNLNLLRFDQYLKRLEKVPHDKSEPWRGWEDTPSPTRYLPNRVFLYHIDQLGDAQDSRLEVFRAQLQTFLNLTQPLQSFRRTNSLRRTYNETIDICDRKHSIVQQALTEVGQEAYAWIKNQFLASDDVTIANQDHFETLLGNFLENPCEARNR